MFTDNEIVLVVRDDGREINLNVGSVIDGGWVNDLDKTKDYVDFVVEIGGDCGWVDLLSVVYVMIELTEKLVLRDRYSRVKC